MKVGVAANVADGTPSFTPSAGRFEPAGTGARHRSVLFALLANGIEFCQNVLRQLQCSGLQVFAQVLQ